MSATSAMDELPETVSREELVGVAIASYTMGVERAKGAAAIREERALACCATIFSVLSAALSLTAVIRLVVKGVL